MEQIKTFLGLVTDLFSKDKPVTAVVDGKTYAIKQDRTLGDYVRPPAPTDKPTLYVQTLTGFIDALTAKVDSFDDKSAVQVIDHQTVALVSLEADEFGRRHEWLRARNGEATPFPFDEFMVPDRFIIALQSGFAFTENTVQLQRLASSLSSESVISVQDDGLSQKIETKQGGVSRNQVDLPPRIPLFAYRTFREVDPTQSEFMVRLQGKTGELPKIALLQIDAGRWKYDTMLMVRKYLEDRLPADTTIIA